VAIFHLTCRVFITVSNWNDPLVGFWEGPDLQPGRATAQQDSALAAEVAETTVVVDHLLLPSSIPASQPILNERDALISTAMSKESPLCFDIGLE